MIPLPLQTGASDILANVQSLLFQALIYGLLPTLMIFATLIRYSRRYFLEKQQRFTFKFAGEQWWMFYAIARYLSIVAVVLVGLVLLWPGLYLNTSVAVPFQPLGFDLFLIAFTLMLVNGKGEDDKLHGTIRRLTLIGTSMYVFGTLILIVCPQQLPISQSSLYGSFSASWMWATNLINSQSNTSLSVFSIYLNIIVLLACVSFAVLHSTASKEKR